MKANYDFSKGRRGAVVAPAASKIKCSVRLDRDIVEWFKSKVEEIGEGNYQSLMNDALREHISRQP